MSAPINSGGAAFPGIEGEEGRGNITSQIAPDGTRVWIYHNQGMTLRDWFAGQALSDLIQSCADGDDKHSNIVARSAYKFADAMIAERAKSSEKS